MTLEEAQEQFLSVELVEDDHPRRPWVLRVVRSKGDRHESFRAPTAQTCLDALDVPRRSVERTPPVHIPTTEERLESALQRIEALEQGVGRRSR